jgi:hypothetical protein
MRIATAIQQQLHIAWTAIAPVHTARVCNVFSYSTLGPRQETRSWSNFEEEQLSSLRLYVWNNSGTTERGSIKFGNKKF